MKYRAEIDGLRAIAVVPVVLFHAGFQLFSGGFVGVDVFFVISGYLITTILIEDIEHKRFNLVNFYERRAKRILPALFFFLIITIPFVLILFPPHAIKDFAQSLLATSLFVSNIFFYIETDYFNDLAEMAPLLHTWSLAVEEQFYFVFPPLLWLLYKVDRNMRVLLICSLTSFSFIAAEYIVSIDPPFSFYMLFTRFWELSVGSIVAIFLVNRSHLPNGVGMTLSVSGLVMVAYSIFAYTKNTVFPGLSATLPVFGTALIILGSTRQNIVQRLLSNAVLVKVGLLSYSLYLSHNIVFSVARNSGLGLDDILAKLLAIMISVILAVFSYKYIETPFRRSSVSKAITFGSSFLIISVLVVVGYYGHQSDGLKSIIISRLLDSHDGLVLDTKLALTARGEYWDEFLPSAGNNYSTDSSARKILILGDSKSEDMYVSMMSVDSNPRQEYRRLRLDIACMDMRFVNSSETCSEQLSGVIQSSLYKKSDYIVLTATWQFTADPDIETLVDRILGDGKGLLILSTSNFNDVASLSYVVAKRGYDVDEEETYLFKNMRLDWRRIFASFRQKLEKRNREIVFIEKLSAFCDLSKETCRLRNGNNWFFWDSGHLTKEGAKHFGKYLNSLKLFVGESAKADDMQRKTGLSE
ncbi:acyltransferase [Pseudomonadales bacterium]|nr:acyltransferase [Pseudomonadales bacterium]